MYFSDAFDVSTDLLAKEDVFDISLVSDLPLFIDPFLIFDSAKPRYQTLHEDIVRYVSFVRNKVVAGNVSPSQLREWPHFPEIPNNWLGYSVGSNAGRGLRDTFARGATIGLRGPVRDFGEETASAGSHIERLFLFSEGSGKDALSDFITNLCHDFLLRFTQRFAKKYLARQCTRDFNVRRVRFDYGKERWANGTFALPMFKSKYVLLTPVDLLTQSVPWINRPDLFDRFGGILEAMTDSDLRDSVNAFLSQKFARPPTYPKHKEYRPSKRERRSAYARALELYPDLANWYVAVKDKSGEEAVAESRKRVLRADQMYRDRVLTFVSSTLRPSGFFDIAVSDRTRLLAGFAKAIEEDGATLFLGEGGLLEALSAEDVRLICTLAWRADGNDERLLPDFRFVYDQKSAAQLEDGLRADENQAGALVVTTDQSKTARIRFLVETRKIRQMQVVSLSACEEREAHVENIFISYTKVDEKWARWIGQVLVSAGYSVTAQYKDFLPGTNFVRQMDEAVKNTDRTVAVLSPDYLKSSYATAEWQAAFRDDPLGQKRKLVPVRVSRANVSGLLGSIVYADLVGLTERSATAVLLGAIGAHNRPAATKGDGAFPGLQGGSDEFQAFLGHMPRTFAKQKGTSDAPRRLALATKIGLLTTNQVNLLIFALNPPDNEIPPVSAPAKDRAASLLTWTTH
jgi:TIR domain